MPDWFKPWGDWGAVGSCVTSEGVATLKCIPIIFSNLLTALLMFVGLFALVMFLAGSFKLLSSRGDPKKIQGVKNTFTYGTIGLVIVLLSFVIMNIIATVTGVKCISGGHFGFGC